MDSTSPPATPSPPIVSPHARQWSFQSLPSPRIAIHHDSSAGPGAERPPLAPHMSAPPGTKYQSPLRHHKRTPSQHREIKETLDARTEYTSHGTEGTQHHINQYVIREEIGRGSYGAVHLATDQFGQEFALKEFSKARLRKRIQSSILRRPDLASSGAGPGPGRLMAQRRQFQSQRAAEKEDALFLIREEIAIMKKLNHPNLVALIEVLDDPEEDSLYMVLEMCQKGVVMKVGLDEDAVPYSEDMCKTWFRDLILGIEYLHAQGVVHRDIKPDNLLLASDDCLKIVDFGVSEMFEKPELMMTKKSAGSPAFQAPELCVARHGDVSGTAADLWSMGVTLYCLRYGKLPFNKPNVLEMYEAIKNDEIPIPADEDATFVDLISRILDKDPNTRITMPELRDHLWVTSGGTDPLLSADENCTTLIEAPDEMEVNHAFTRKMSHMFVVMRAIHRFKSLISKSKPSTPEASNLKTFSSLAIPSRIVVPGVEKVKSLTSNVIPEPQPLTPPIGNTENRTVAEEAAELVRLRQDFLASKSSGLTAIPSENLGEDRNTAGTPQPNWPPPGLGVQAVVGEEHHDANAHATEQQFVSESPTGIDFEESNGSIYDQAFSAEIKRIRSQKSKERSKTYLTRLVGSSEKQKWMGHDFMVADAEKSAVSATRHGDEDIKESLADKLETSRVQVQESAARLDEAVRAQGSRFADIVVQMARSKTATDNTEGTEGQQS